mmetsp:Transcript_17954/g.38561  ORF Transcript_17954/g.38561 Transcript_17954/m.38561 type:complete len:203 (-) Transcript_17954:795-1403(-)
MIRINRRTWTQQRTYNAKATLCHALFSPAFPSPTPFVLCTSSPAPSASASAAPGASCGAGSWLGAGLASDGSCPPPVVAALGACPSDVSASTTVAPALTFSWLVAARMLSPNPSSMTTSSGDTTMSLRLRSSFSSLMLISCTSERLRRCLRPRFSLSFSAHAILDSTSMRVSTSLSSLSAPTSWLSCCTRTCRSSALSTAAL